jgi:hypothetical protein
MQSGLQFQIAEDNVMRLFAHHARIVALAKSKGSDRQPSTPHDAEIRALLDAIPWTSGLAGKKMYEGTKIGQYDESAVELRSADLMRLDAGLEPERDYSEVPTQFPPRTKSP